MTMNIKEHEFRELLSGAIKREKQAYRRATYLTAIPVLIGLILFSFFTYRAIKLRQESSLLDAQIQDKTRQLGDLANKLETSQSQLATTAAALADSQRRLEESHRTLEESRVGLEKIKTGKVDPKRQATEILQVIGKTAKRE